MNDTISSEQPLSSGQLNRFHWRVIITAGMGFFTDAYDLFIIGVVTALLAPLWHLTVTQLALLNGASLAAAAFGAVFFGTLSDKLGRKRLYGYEVMILFFGALLSAASPSYAWLLISRIIVGFGIGGDYPTSAVVASEHSNSKNRGFIVLLVFAMQAIGLIFGPALAAILLASGLSHDWVWRILLGLGAVPAASVFYLRRRIEETPHFLRTQSKAPLEVSRVVRDLAKEKKAAPYRRQRLSSKKWLTCLVGTAGAWFLLDVAFYGNGVSSVLIMNAIAPNASLLAHTLISAGIFLVFAVPGYFMAAKYVDKIGRKPLQCFGFFIMALAYGLIAWVPAVTSVVPLFITIFGLSFFFVNFGPNTTTFLIPSEIYPTSIRARAHGLSAAIGKVGAFVGAFLLPIILKQQGMPFTMGMMVFVSLAGIFITFLIPEMKQVSLVSVEEVQPS